MSKNHSIDFAFALMSSDAALNLLVNCYAWAGREAAEDSSWGPSEEVVLYLTERRMVESLTRMKRGRRNASKIDPEIVMQTIVHEFNQIVEGLRLDEPAILDEFCRRCAHRTNRPTQGP